LTLNNSFPFLKLVTNSIKSDISFIRLVMPEINIWATTQILCLQNSENTKIKFAKVNKNVLKRARWTLTLRQSCTLSRTFRSNTSSICWDISLVLKHNLPQNLINFGDKFIFVKFKEVLGIDILPQLLQIFFSSSFLQLNNVNIVWLQVI